MTRAQNSFLNFITNALSSVLIPILNFVTRTVFIRALGSGYLGIEGTFSTILSMLSLADLGFDAAIAYELYAPIEHKDFERIHALMDLYKKIYRIIGFVILIAGACLIPLLPALVKDYELFAELGLNAVVIFLMYLFNTASSYWFFSYKATLVSASQKSYLLTVTGYAVRIAGALAQILTLTLTHSFMLYLAVQILFTIIQRLINAIVCDRRYPFLRQRCETKVSKDDRRRIFRDCYAIFFHRANGMILSASDTLVLTAMAGLIVVGRYSNYLAISSAVYGILRVFMSSIQASMGSIFSTDRKDWAQLLFRTVQYVASWLYGVGAIGVALLADEFIRDIWRIGGEFVISSWTRDGVTVATPLALFIGLEIYSTGYANISSLFRNSSGLFHQLRYRPIASILVNLVISLATVPYLGIVGCVIGTIVSLLTTDVLIDFIVIHKYALELSPRKTFLRFFLYTLMVAASGLLCAWLCRLIPLVGIVGFLLRGAICVLVPSAVFFGCTFRTLEFRYLRDTALSILKKPKTSEGE